MNTQQAIPNPSGIPVFGSSIVRVEPDVASLSFAVVAAGAAEIAGADLQTTRLEEARRRAIEAARKKALVYCTAAGVTLGLPIHIEDVNPDILNGSRGGHVLSSEPPSEDVGTLRAFDPGWIAINAAVQVVYAFSTPPIEGDHP